MPYMPYKLECLGYGICIPTWTIFGLRVPSASLRFPAGESTGSRPSSPGWVTTGAWLSQAALGGDKPASTIFTGRHCSSK